MIQVSSTGQRPFDAMVWTSLPVWPNVGWVGDVAGGGRRCPEVSASAASRARGERAASAKWAVSGGPGDKFLLRVRQVAFSDEALFEHAAVQLFGIAHELNNPLLQTI